MILIRFSHFTSELEPEIINHESYNKKVIQKPNFGQQHPGLRSSVSRPRHLESSYMRKPNLGGGRWSIVCVGQAFSSAAIIDANRSQTWRNVFAAAEQQRLRQIQDICVVAS